MDLTGLRRANEILKAASVLFATVLDVARWGLRRDERHHLSAVWWWASSRSATTTSGPVSTTTIVTTASASSRRDVAGGSSTVTATRSIVDRTPRTDGLRHGRHLEAAAAHRTGRLPKGRQDSQVTDRIGPPEPIPGWNDSLPSGPTRITSPSIPAAIRRSDRRVLPPRPVLSRSAARARSVVCLATRRKARGEGHPSELLGGAWLSETIERPGGVGRCLQQRRESDASPSVLLARSLAQAPEQPISNLTRGSFSCVVGASWVHRRNLSLPRK